MIGDKEPIKTQAEAIESFAYLVAGCMVNYKITKDQAAKRVNALLESGILDAGDSRKTRRLIDNFLAKKC